MLDLSHTLEKISTKSFTAQQQGSLWIAEEIKKIILEKQKNKHPCVLGFATGSSVKYVYQYLIEMYNNKELSFYNVITFNLDEYFPIKSSDVNSYYYFMYENLFKHIDIPKENINIPNGEINKDDIQDEVYAYEEKIKKLGGIDLQILGIGVNGHIGFNEPGSHLKSRTRLVHLENTTRISNSKFFGDLIKMPRLAITMGIETILSAKKIILMAWGNSKATIVQQAVEGYVTENIPASLLQYHFNSTFVLDENSSQELARVKTPWLTGASCVWDIHLIKKAVLQLSLKLQKPILNLVSQDYIDNGLGELLVTKGNVYEVNLMVYYTMRDSLTGWPGGKKIALPNAPERQTPYPKKIVIFSPHPDDDIISMGGTFMRLHEHGHDVHVAYQTSGNIAVTDEFVTRFLDFSLNYEKLFNIEHPKTQEIVKSAYESIVSKKSPYDKDSEEIRQIKGLIRRCEAKATCRYVGIPDSNIHFQNLPFYESGTIEKNPMGEADIKITIDLLNKLKPHQIFCAGDLADPHGTHKICIEIIFEAIKRLKTANAEWLKDCWIWMYKGAWQEWDIEDIEMAVPMNPEQVKKKRHGIFIHQSQKDIVPFQGADSREFWQRAEERNTNTANIYGQLGLTKYAAVEAFKRWYF